MCFNGICTFPTVDPLFDQSTVEDNSLARHGTVSGCVSEVVKKWVDRQLFLIGTFSTNLSVSSQAFQSMLLLLALLYCGSQKNGEEH